MAKWQDGKGEEEKARREYEAEVRRELDEEFLVERAVALPRLDISGKKNCKNP